MAGHLNGLVLHLQSKEHRMLHVHCMAHYVFKTVATTAAA